MRLARRETMLLGAVLALAGLGVLWWLWIAPARSDVADTRQELSGLTAEVYDLNDTVTRLRAAEPGAARRTAERLRLAKALPATDQVPAAVLQLQRLATRSGVRLHSLRSSGANMYGQIRTVEYSMEIRGRFHDVDDFMYRMHHQVRLDDQQRPQIEGRLLAVKDLTLAPVNRSRRGSSTIADRDLVQGTMVVVAYSAPADQDASAVTMAASDPVAAVPSTGVGAPVAPIGPGEQAAATMNPGG